MSNLLKHAEREMKMAGLDKPGSDYDGMIYDSVMKLVGVLSGEGHSGGSHWVTMQVFNKVANYKTLTPITSNPDEWTEFGPNVWQNNRTGSDFSDDGGKTWYNIDDKTMKNRPKNRKLHQRIINRIKRALK